MQGLHLTADCHDCNCAAHWLTDAQALVAACGRAVLAAGLQPVSELAHRFPDTAGFGQKIQEAELDYVVNSESMSRSLAENYVGLPLNFGER